MGQMARLQTQAITAPAPVPKDLSLSLSHLPPCLVVGQPFPLGLAVTNGTDRLLGPLRVRWGGGAATWAGAAGGVVAEGASRGIYLHGMCANAGADEGGRLSPVPCMCTADVVTGTGAYLMQHRQGHASTCCRRVHGVGREATCMSGQLRVAGVSGVQRPGGRECSGAWLARAAHDAPLKPSACNGAPLVTDQCSNVLLCDGDWLDTAGGAAPSACVPTGVVVDGPESVIVDAVPPRQAVQAELHMVALSPGQHVLEGVVLEGERDGRQYDMLPREEIFVLPPMYEELGPAGAWDAREGTQQGGPAAVHGVCVS